MSLPLICKLRYKVLGVIEYDFSQFTPDITKRVCVDSASPGVYHKPGGMCVPRNALGFKFVEIGQAEKKGACPCPRCLPDYYVTYKK